MLFSIGSCNACFVAVFESCLEAWLDDELSPFEVDSCVLF